MTRQATALLLLAAAVAGLAGLFLVSGNDQPDGADLLAGAGGSVTRTAEPEVEAKLSDLQARPAEGTREAALARPTREEAGVRNRVR